MKHQKDSSKEFIVLNALAFYTSQNYMVEVNFHPCYCQYRFKVFVNKDEIFTTYSYLEDIASSHEVCVFDEGTNHKFTVHTFIVDCAICDNQK